VPLSFPCIRINQNAADELIHASLFFPLNQDCTFLSFDPVFPFSSSCSTTGKSSPKRKKEKWMTRLYPGSISAAVASWTVFWAELFAIVYDSSFLVGYRVDMISCSRLFFSFRLALFQVIRSRSETFPFTVQGRSSSSRILCADASAGQQLCTIWPTTATE
jgi:hypothetical protein